MNGNRVTVTMTAAQLLSLLEAASRGMDEWDYEPGDANTPVKRVRDSALRAYQIALEVLDGKVTA